VTWFAVAPAAAIRPTTGRSHAWNAGFNSYSVCAMLLAALSRRVAAAYGFRRRLPSLSRRCGRTYAVVRERTFVDDAGAHSQRIGVR
jgi:hypothetical protein